MDIFIRKENFESENWYNEFCIFLNIGICKVLYEEVDDIKNALNQMGYKNLSTKKEGEYTYIY